MPTIEPKTERTSTTKTKKSQTAKDEGSDSHQCLISTLFKAFDEENRGRISVQRMTAMLEKQGLRSDDPRLAGFFSIVNRWVEEGLDFDRFSAAIEPSIVLIEKAMSGNLTIPDFEGFSEKINDIYTETFKNKDGNVATYIPQLARVAPDKFGVSICTIDGQRASFGDSTEYFSIQSTCKPITYCLALEENAQDKVHKHVGREPSGHSFNFITLDSKKRPHNPMINAGAIMCSALIKPNLDSAARFDYVQEQWARLCGGHRPVFNNSVYLSEKETADRNFALAYFMREHKVFPEDSDLLKTLEFYFQCCSMELTTDQFAIAAATLARGGTCPLTNDRVLNTDSVKHCLSLMLSCGMYDFSGEFAFAIGLPAKSGVGGGLMVVIPNLMGICIWSPKLDSLGNSVRGIEFCKRLVSSFNFHNYDSLVEVSTEKSDPRLKKHATKMEGVVAMCWAAALGDINEIRQLLVRGVNPNQGDYDGRTAMHLASSEGHLETVQFLLNHGADLAPKDRWGGTPLDDAKREGHEELVKFLTNYYKLKDEKH